MSKLEASPSTASEEEKYDPQVSGPPSPNGEQPYEKSINSSHILQERTLGVWSGIFLIVNKIIGAGIFSTPGNIYRNAGSVGLALFIWVIAGVINTCGAFMLLELGTGIPRSGGLKNYLERAYTPRLAATCVYGFYCVFLQVSASNAITFSSYVLLAADQTATTWRLRGVAIAATTFAVFMFAVFPRTAMLINNVTGAVKVFMLLFIICTGFAALAGHLNIDNPHNFDNAFEGTSDQVYGIATALLNGIFSFGGYDNVNAVLSEFEDPVRSLKIIIPSSMSLVAVLYMLANIAYFAGVTKTQFKTSSVTVAASLFGNVFGHNAATKALPALVSLSALGHLIGIAKTVPVVIQELAKEDVLIFNNAVMSNRPFKTPIAALVVHWLVTIIFICAPPAGEAFSFIVSLSSYPTSFIMLLIAIGLFRIRRDPNWAPAFKTPLPVLVVFMLGSLFLLIAPLIPPAKKTGTIPYYLSSVIPLGIVLLGIPYYLIRFVIAPKALGYNVFVQQRPLPDGSVITRHKWVKKE